MHPKRKNMRLACFNYHEAGVYHLILCAKDRQCIFSSIITETGVLTLTATGEVVNRAIAFYNGKYHLWIHRYVIMPNHVHILVEHTVSDREGTLANTAISKFVSGLKRYTNRECKMDLWQRSFRDHIIRSEKAFQAVWQYIENNPMQWANDEYFRSQR